jgi:predicted DNA-binding transcriptional regulator AlpA
MRTTAPPSASADPLLDDPAAAAYIGATPKFLQTDRTTRRYAIPYIKVGRLVRYRQSALDAWLESRTVNGPQP